MFAPPLFQLPALPYTKVYPPQRSLGARHLSLPQGRMLFASCSLAGSIVTMRSLRKWSRRSSFGFRRRSHGARYGAIVRYGRGRMSQAFKHTATLNIVAAHGCSEIGLSSTEVGALVPQVFRKAALNPTTTTTVCKGNFVQSWGTTGLLSRLAKIKQIDRGT